MEQQKIAHFLYMPLTGLGLYGGHRGKRWLKNRIKIFKQFVLPSLLTQTDPNFILWVSARYEDKNDPILQDLKKYLDKCNLRNVFTYAGVCFWDDKYPDEVAHDRLAHALQGSMAELLNSMGEAETILMTIQPSDDVYHRGVVGATKDYFERNPSKDVYGFKEGYVMDYVNRKLAEWNPTTTPPFYTIKFERKTFMDPFKHMAFIGPYKSHEYVKDYLNVEYIDERAFIVGIHGENISTVFDHPFTGHEFLGDNIERILDKFGLAGIKPLKLPFSLRKWFMKKLPYGWKRKLRYWLGERFGNRIYNWLRS